MLPGRSAREAEQLAQDLQTVLKHPDPPPGLKLGPLEALTSVRHQPGRVGCVWLPWLALLLALPPLFGRESWLQPILLRAGAVGLLAYPRPPDDPAKTLLFWFWPTAARRESPAGRQPPGLGAACGWAGRPCGASWVSSRPREW